MAFEKQHIVLRSANISISEITAHAEGMPLGDVPHRDASRDRRLTSNSECSPGNAMSRGHFTSQIDHKKVYKRFCF